MKTPWQYAETGNEFSHQVALFMWAAMAVQFGVKAANDPELYLKKDNLWRAELRRVAIDKIPELQWLHAIKNAGHGDAIRGARSAAEGVKAGVPDIFLPVPKWRGDTYRGGPVYNVCGLYIELKRPKAIVLAGGRRQGKMEAGRVSDAQTKWREYLLSAGYAVETCYGWEAARDAILKYLGR